MKTINLTKHEIVKKDFVKRPALRKDFKTLIAESCILKHDGMVIGVYLVLPKISNRLLKAIKRIDIGGRNKRSGGIRSESRVFGNSPRDTMRKDYCSSAMLAHDFHYEHEMICSYGAELAKHYKKHCPEMYNYHNDLAQQKVKPNWIIKDSPFTSGIINKNSALNYHFDTGNFQDVYSNMLAFKKDIGGGYLSLPEFDVGLEIANNSVLFFDGQKILHGVTKIKYKSPNAYRYTLVYYTLKRMWQCLEPKEELDRIKQVKTDREIGRLKRLKGEIPNEI